MQLQHEEAAPLFHSLKENRRNVLKPDQLVLLQPNIEILVHQLKASPIYQVFPRYHCRHSISHHYSQVFCLVLASQTSYFPPDATVATALVIISMLSNPGNSGIPSLTLGEGRTRVNGCRRCAPLGIVKESTGLLQNQLQLYQLSVAA